MKTFYCPHCDKHIPYQFSIETGHVIMCEGIQKMIKHLEAELIRMAKEEKHG